MKKTIFSVVLGFTVLLLVSSCDEISDLLDDSSSTQTSSASRQSYGRLPNTTWICEEAGLLGASEKTIDFGNGNYLYTEETYYYTGWGTSETETGTYTVSGDTVLFTSNGETTKIGSGESRQINGTIIGNSLTVGGSTYR